MKVWLDDIRNPASRFIQDMYGAEPDMIWVKTAEGAIDLISNGNVEFISLDHDLGCKDSGYDVARYIEMAVQRKWIKMPKWRCHSDNPVGKDNIKRAMENAEKYA